MKWWKNLLRIRLLIPLILVAYAFILVLNALFIELPTTLSAYRNNSNQQLRMRMNWMQGSFNRLIRTKNFDALKQEVTFVSTLPGMELILVLDEREKVIAANHFEMLYHMPENKIYPKEWQLIHQAIRQYRGVTWSNEDEKKITGAFPLQMDPGINNIRSDKIGLLFIRYDYGPEYNTALMRVYERLVVEISLLMILTAGLWFFTYRILHRPIRSLVDGSQRLGEGNYDVRIPPSFSPDLQDLGNTFNKMAEAIGQSDLYIRKNEARLLSLMQNIATGVVVHNADTSIVQCNPAASRILGLTEEQMLGKAAIDPAWHFVREDGSELPLEEYPVMQVLYERVPFEAFSIGVCHPDKKEITWVLVNGVPEFTADGLLERIIISFIDITQRRNTQEALKQSEETYHSMISSLSEGVLMEKSNGEIVGINESACRMLGLTLEQLEGEISIHSLLQAITEDGKPLPRELHPAMVTFATGQPQRHFIMGVHKSTGGLIWISVNSEPMFIGTGGKPRAVVSSFTDITEQRMAESSLIENRRYLRSLLDSQPNIVVINDGEYLVDTNRAFFNFFTEYDSLDAFREEHKCICEYFDPVDRPDFLRERMDGLSWIEILKNNPERLYKALITHNGEKFTFAVKIEEFIKGDESLNIVTFSDITIIESDQRALEFRMEEALEKQRKQERQLLQQSKIIQMGEMVTNLSHHWRQPLNLIGINIQDILDVYDFGEITREYLVQNINESLSTLVSMSNTLERFRDFMVQKSDKGIFRVESVIEKTLEILRPAMENHFIEITTEFAHGAEAFGESDLLGQALYNIISNAKDTLIERKIKNRKVTISMKINESSEININIQDNAGGIEENIMPRIFEPFFTTKDLATRTGTGLYFAKIIIEREMRGKISVTNCDNGACVRINLPRWNADSSQDATD